MPGSVTWILVVDDDPHVRSGLEAGLTLQAYRVATAANGREALAWLEKHHPHLVVLDLHMPELDGYGLIDELRHRGLHPHVPIVVLSGDSEGAERAAGLGVAAFLPKPVSLATLLATVTRLLSGSTELIK